jgi:folate-dependent phosphoribosylglycinamide formyltransferase PurN
VAEPGGVAVLTRTDPLTYLHVNALRARFEVRQVIYEHPGPGYLPRQLTRRVRRLGLLTVLDQGLYVAFDRLSVRRRSRARIQQLLAAFDTTPPGPEVPQLVVRSINDEAVAQALDRARPQVCVVSGTSLLKPRLLEKAPVFLNVHAGLTPRYRGAHGAYWAVWEGRPDLAGVTVHQVDRGIDTGGIVAQALIAVAPDDTPRTLVAKQLAASVPLLLDAVERALAGELTTYRLDDLESRLWYPPTASSYLRYRRQLARLARDGRLAQDSA